MRNLTLAKLEGKEVFHPVPVGGASSVQESTTGADDIATAASPCHIQRVLDLAPFQNLRLRGGFVLAEVQLAAQPLWDPLERAAAAQTVIRSNRFHILLRADLDERELSVSLYHEVLEAATVAAEFPPDSVVEFNEGAFERAAQAAHAEFGPASPETLNRMLVEFGF